MLEPWAEPTIIATEPIKAATGIAIIGVVPTLIATEGGLGRTWGGQTNDRFAGLWGSERQAGGEHLLLQFAGAIDLQCLLEQRLYLTGFRAQHLGQHLRYGI